MYDDTLASPLKSPFLGKWKVLTQSHHSLSSACSNHVCTNVREVEITPRGSSQHHVFEIKLFEHDNSSPPKATIHLSYDRDTKSLYRNDLPSKKICISFWRQAAYDVIFALCEDDEGTPAIVWSAQRKPSEDPGLEPVAERTMLQALAEHPWKIRLASGFHAAHGAIRIGALTPTDLPLPHPRPEDLIGLYQLRDEIPGSGELYDILAYDATSGSFNSIFGVRSLNYWIDPNSGDPRIFATFNNQYSLPETRLHPGGQPSLGRPLKLESEALNSLAAVKLLKTLELEPRARHEVESAFAKAMGLECFRLPVDDDVEDDPDVAVWVGTPRV